MKKIMGAVLTSIGIFGIIFGIFDFQHGSKWAGRTFSYSYYYYTDETRFIMGASAVILFFGIMLFKRKVQI